MSSNKQIKSNGAYKAEVRGSSVFVSVSPDVVKRFAESWPHSHFNTKEPIVFTYHHSNGDLIDYEPSHNTKDADASALLALSHDACDFAVEVGLLPRLAHSSADYRERRGILINAVKYLAVSYSTLNNTEAEAEAAQLLISLV